MARGSQASGAGPSAFAYLCLTGTVAIAVYFAHLRNIRIDWTFNFAEAFMRQMDWPWAAGGFLLSIIGCVAGEKARNREAGFIATVAVIGCLLLALGNAMILLYSVGGFAQILDFLR